MAFPLLKRCHLKVFIIMACHNRRDSTLRCIRSAHEAADRARLAIHVTLYDDGSSDSTAEAVSAQYPHTKILRGTGADYWARSMSIAEASVLDAIRRNAAEHVYVMWLNDDVVLDVDAFERLQKAANQAPDDIIVGAVRDPISAEVTYSALTRRGRHPLSYAVVPPSSAAETVEIFNGNLVLIPGATAILIGGIDGEYSHALADIDYGLRAKAESVGVKLAPGTYGTCARNPTPPVRSLTADWQEFLGPKGAGNPTSMVKILRLGAPRSWPLYFLASYALWWLRRLPITPRRISRYRRSERPGK